MLREVARSEDRAPESRGQLLDARREVHRRADTGEVQSVPATDIAIENAAEMERQSEPHALGTLTTRRALECCDVCPRGAGRGQHPPADLAEIPIALDFRVSGDPKDREQPIAHEFQHFAILIEDRRDLTIEIPVEQVDQNL